MAYNRIFQSIYDISYVSDITTCNLTAAHGAFNPYHKPNTSVLSKAPCMKLQTEWIRKSSSPNISSVLSVASLFRAMDLH